jgi:ABC-2 type transport system ATP-binding protein
MLGRITISLGAESTTMVASTDPSLAARGLTRDFGDLRALSDVDLAVDGPQVVGVAGPNGSGKTTLIHCLLGLLRPTDGHAEIGGVDALSFDPADRARVGYMPQDAAVYRDLSVRENVAFFARLYGVTDREAAVQAALETVDMADRGGARIPELSGGMVRRTSLACALVHDPDVLVLDEPTVGLDPELRASMWAGFRERRDAGTLVLVSTHYLGEARRCDRVLFLRAGEVLAMDSPAGFLERTGAEDMEAAFLALLEGEDTDRNAAEGPV